MVVQGKYCELGESEVNGFGVMAAEKVPEDTIVAKIVERKNRVLNVTPIGKMVNHSSEPNSELVLMGSEVYLKTMEEINKGDEYLADYDNPDNPWFIKGFK